MQTNNGNQKQQLLNITVKFQEEKTVQLQNTTLVKVAKKLLNTQSFINLQPMLIVFSTGKQLYFNKNEWYQFLHNEIDIKELIENCETEGLWRNNAIIIFKNKLDVDPGALWTRKENQLFLVNDDWNIIDQFSEALFDHIM